MSALWSAPEAQAAVTYDNSSISNAVATASSLTYSLTVGSGTNRGLVVFVGVGSDCSLNSNPPTISSVTYAGVSLIQIDNMNFFPVPCSGGPLTRLYIWSLPAGTQPISGANNVVVTFSAALRAAGPKETVQSGAVSVAGVDPATTFSSFLSGNFNTGSPQSINLTASYTNDLVVSFVTNGGSITSPVAPLSQVKINNVDAGTTANNSALATGPGGTTSLGWNIDAADGVTMIAGVSFKARPTYRRVINE